MRSKHNTSDSTDANDYVDQIREFTEARESLVYMHTRLILRLGQAHAVTKACGEALTAIDNGGTDVLVLVQLDQPRPDDWQDRSINERQGMWAANQRFVEAASEFVSAPIRSWD